MEDIFKTKEGDREKEIDRFQKALAELEPQLLKIDRMYVTDNLEKDSYQRMKASYKKEIQKLQAQIFRLKSTDTNFMKYCRYGMSLLGNLDFHYQESSPHVRKKLLGSIFTGKLIFENGNYRTTGLNEAVALIGLFQKDLENKKAERLGLSDKTFGNVPGTGLEPARTCVQKILSLLCLPFHHLGIKTDEHKTHLLLSHFFFGSSFRSLDKRICRLSITIKLSN